MYPTACQCDCLDERQSLCNSLTKSPIFVETVLVIELAELMLEPLYFPYHTDGQLTGSRRICFHPELEFRPYLETNTLSASLLLFPIQVLGYAVS